ncbi:MAG: DUF177 domain-containing protein [SAR324 cluster bacterium]|nr:DUF177 domain-containing protein [SAR324 cluster bacterium]
MNIKLHQISESLSRFDFHLASKDLLRLEDRFSFDSMACVAELVLKRGMVQLHGSYSVEMATSCNICLEPVSVKLDREFDLSLMDEESYAEPEGDVEISLQSDDLDFYRGQEIILAEYFEDQLLLDLPFSIKCSEECKGICPKCGVNRNTESCQCTEEFGNNPFSALGDLEH